METNTKESIRADIFEAIKTAVDSLKKVGYSRSEICTRAGIHRSSMDRWLARKSLPTLEAYFAIVALERELLNDRINKAKSGLFKNRIDTLLPRK